MDDIIFKLPPTIPGCCKPAYLTVGACPEGWRAGYITVHGGAMKNFYTTGRSPSEALLNLKECVDLLEVLNMPAVRVDEDKNLC